MGRPSNLKPRPPRGTSRRAFFAKSGSAAAALASVPMLALAARSTDDKNDDGSRAGKVGFEHGVASGDPHPYGVILWTRVTPASRPASVSVRYEIATDPQLRQVVDRGVQSTGPERDYTVKVDATALRPRENPFRAVLLLTSARDALVDTRCTLAMGHAWRCEVRSHPFAGHDLPLDDPDWVIAQATSIRLGSKPER